MVKNFIKKIRPDFKGFSNDISNKDLAGELLFYLACLIRGLFSGLLYLRINYVLLGKKTILFYKSKIYFGKKVKIGNFCILSGMSKKGLFVGDYSSIGSFSRVIVSTNHSNLGEYIKIGSGVGIGEYSSLGGSGGLSIGDNTIIAQYFSAHPENHVFDSTEVPIKAQGTFRSPISIGKDCWIGAKVTIVAGVTVGDGVVLGAGSVVTKDIPAYTIAVGNPAKVIKSRKND